MMAEMIEFFKSIVQPGMLPYTILLGIAVLYWIVMMMGAVDLDFLDFDLDGAADGAVDGALDGALDGAVDSALDGVVDGAVDGVADGGLEGAADGLEAGVEGSGSMLHNLLQVLNVGSVPIPIIASILFLLMWIGAYMFHIVLRPMFGETFPGVLFALVALLGTLVVAVPITAMLTRPMRKVFAHYTQHAGHYLVGKTCLVKSTSISETFGQAEVKTAGSPILLSVYCEDENDMTKGDEAVVVGYDEQKHKYHIKPLGIIHNREAI